MGYRAFARGNNATAIGTDARADFAGSTAVGRGTVTTAANQVAIGTASDTVQVAGLGTANDEQSGTIYLVTADEDGTLGRTAFDTGTLGGGTGLQRGLAAAMPIAAISDAQFNALSSDVTALTGRVGALEGQVGTLFDLSNTLEKDLRQSIAATTALAQPHFPSEDGATSYASNVASFRGEMGFSAGLAHRVNRSFALTSGVSYGGGDNVAFKAGVAGEF
ncbi:hypothetical protein [Pseudoblastomonas halimionae]|uniref:hypothetical protein n=1 Tax=Alteriqipengyuania halimionae TaxID=1926630 RepID=UPI001367C247|nr:hypothetical protein [Alteriqipengyuania halimionae]